MTKFEDNLQAAKANAWSWNLDAIKAAKNQLQELQKSGGAFKAKDIHGKEQSYAIEKDKEPTNDNNRIREYGLRFQPIQLCGTQDLPQEQSSLPWEPCQTQSDLPGGEDCPIWVEEVFRDQDCKLENHVAEMDRQRNLMGSALTSDTFYDLRLYLEKHVKDAQEINNVVCFGLTDNTIKNILNHDSDPGKQEFQGRAYIRYLMCAYISWTLRDILRKSTNDPERQLKMYIQGHSFCYQEKYLLGIGFRPEIGETPEEEAELEKAYEKSNRLGGYPAEVLEDAGGLLELKKNTFIVSFDQRVPVRQIAAQALAGDNGPAGMFCLDIIDDGTAADCQNHDGRNRDLSSPDLKEWQASCLDPLVSPVTEKNFEHYYSDLFRNMKLFLKKKQDI
ncbi:hypothetical protein BDV96DRAFT_689198 [Lophiotrema nucula]|uniref:SRR1-like domain-containing protein n=1 Tax=Lophiotrema nucula TaxID=690887 RepID=A0A6A5Z1W6_9PLEO|nr:hypothetical protein BDV96DRAFT_689198 [Lophiotrema nucula]